MQNLMIEIDVNEKQQQIVSARTLHEGLGISKDFTSWFKNQIERLKLREGVDFTPFRVESTGGRPSVDYAVVLDIAKHICMVSGGEKAWEIRDYFIEVEKQWNSPEAVMARALKMADNTLLEYKSKVIELQQQVEYKTEVIKGITEDVDILTKRNVLNRVVKYKKANFQQRWNELYRVFKETYSVDLKARCEGYNLKQKKKKDQLSVIKYAEKFGHLDNLYKVALKLYETDIKEILDGLEKIA
ncbi:antA/AntB antirepressor family protein [Alkaliphilus sp. MSJ-5]|uniref:AntA/AntB antirepressor family protein n=1 Tax=Alkaliphilus flagellatus TaxID=2841507 RepID=A0ABS6G8K3_9FIRM|nr:antA/AntB antirepressor family protein [Alkaliphilus flagellatus]MBU5677745.1 antA/AntB antirepressor family protein [Alkaliphilus flagellatus]